MTFFVTSIGVGRGADLGGLEGADRHCQSLAAAVGAGDRTWRAYLSTQASAVNDPTAVHARDRVDAGPWYNAKGILIAQNVEDLHSANNRLSKETALNEHGAAVNGHGDEPLMHDMLTGSRPDGTAFPPKPFPDMTCGNWTKDGTDGAAMVGHHDRIGPMGPAGPIQDAWAKSWNSAHPSLGCSQAALRETGGEGLFYCFAVK